MPPAPAAFSIKTDLRPPPGAPDARRHYAEVLEEVALADRLGFNGVWTTEQHGWADGYLGAQLPVLAAFAVATSSLRVGTGVLPLPFYRPRQVAEAAIAVDLVSGGRLDLGLGIGVYPREFELFGVEMRGRGAAMEEGLVLLRAGLADGLMGDGPGGAGVPVSPRPAQARVPLLVGGAAGPAVDRAVRLADGYFGSGRLHAEEEIACHYEDVLAPALERHGRSLSDFRYVTNAPLWVTEDPEREWREGWGVAFRRQQQGYVDAMENPQIASRAAEEGYDMSKVLIGTAGDLAARLHAMRQRAPWHELGFHHRLPGVTHDQALAQLEAVSSRLTPALRAVASSNDSGRA